MPILHFSGMDLVFFRRVTPFLCRGGKEFQELLELISSMSEPFAGGDDSLLHSRTGQSRRPAPASPDDLILSETEGIYEKMRAENESRSFPVRFCPGAQAGGRAAPSDTSRRQRKYRRAKADTDVRSAIREPVCCSGTTPGTRWVPQDENGTSHDAFPLF